MEKPALRVPHVVRLSSELCTYALTSDALRVINFVILWTVLAFEIYFLKIFLSFENFVQLVIFMSNPSP